MASNTMPLIGSDIERNVQTDTSCTASGKSGQLVPQTSVIRANRTSARVGTRRALAAAESVNEVVQYNTHHDDGAQPVVVAKRSETTFPRPLPDQVVVIHNKNNGTHEARKIPGAHTM